MQSSTNEVHSISVKRFLSTTNAKTAVHSVLDWPMTCIAGAERKSRLMTMRFCWAV